MVVDGINVKVHYLMGVVRRTSTMFTIVLFFLMMLLIKAHIVIIDLFYSFLLVGNLLREVF